MDFIIIGLVVVGCDNIDTTLIINCFNQKEAFLAYKLWKKIRRKFLRFHIKRFTCGSKSFVFREVIQGNWKKLREINILRLIVKKSRTISRFDYVWSIMVKSWFDENERNENGDTTMTYFESDQCRWIHSCRGGFFYKASLPLWNVTADLVKGANTDRILSLLFVLPDNFERKLTWARWRNNTFSFSIVEENNEKMNSKVELFYRREKQLYKYILE